VNGRSLLGIALEFVLVGWRGGVCPEGVTEIFGIYICSCYFRSPIEHCLPAHCLKVIVLRGF
jgi:hypothetical protein